ncbi:unnamed protein product [Linum tenue]|uniref:Uncharacterized protein n=1 Tax=Linum tenue TaxID=586396 RepID=A0AAV0LP06_9ROSI|nr:unnamed protein product [Linum tenue]
MSFTFSNDTYSLKAEKADAIRKFNQQQNFLYFGRLLGATVLLLWSFKTLPFLTQMASAYISVFGQQLCAFLVANAIVIFVYHFSTAAANNTIAAAADKDVVVNSSSPGSSPLRSDIYDEYVSLSSRPTGGVEELPPPSDNASDGLVEPAAAAEEGFSDGRRLRRTRSVVVEATATESCGGGGNSSRHEKGCDKKELRRSETVVMKARRKPAAAAAAALGKSLSFNQARKSIEEMNNDEFNMTVESFIATKKKLLRDENIAVLETGI